MTDQQFERFLELLGAMVTKLDELKPITPPPTNLQFAIEDYPNFDFAKYGIAVLKSDQDGPTVIESAGRVYRRRCPSNKYGAAIWYSRGLGRDEDGETSGYECLIKFSQFKVEDIDPLTDKAKQLFKARPVPQPADELAQKRAANAAATAAQAPYRAVAPAPACPSGVSPDVWDAHCAAVAVIDNLTSDWRSQRQLGQWLGEMIQAEEYESTDLYACHPEDIAKVEAVIRGLNAKPTGEISKEMQRNRFRAICAKLGYFDRADSVEKQFTANGVVDWKSAATKIMSLAQVQK